MEFKKKSFKKKIKFNVDVDLRIQVKSVSHF